MCWREQDISASVRLSLAELHMSVMDWVNTAFLWRNTAIIESVIWCGCASVCRVNSVIAIGVGAGAYILSRFAVSSDIFQLFI